MRFHAPQLEAKFPSLHLEVKQHMAWYVGRVQKLYPTLIHVRYNLLLSNPNAPEQDFHFDFMDHTTQNNPEQQPVSLIVAIDPFLLVTVEEPFQDDNSTATGKLITHCVQPGSCIIFTNKVQHAGGKNIFQIDGKPAHAVRIFAYMVSDERDFPSDTVTYFPDYDARKELSRDDDANDADDESDSGFTNRGDNANDADDKSESGFRKIGKTGDTADDDDKPESRFKKKSDMRDDDTSDEDTFYDDNLQYCQKPVWDDDEEMNDDDESNSGKESSVPIPAMDPPSPAIHHPERSARSVSVYREAIRIVQNFTSTHNSLPPPLPPVPSRHKQMQDLIQRVPLAVRECWQQFMMQEKNRAAKKR